MLSIFCRKHCIFNNLINCTKSNKINIISCHFIYIHSFIFLFWESIWINSTCYISFIIITNSTFFSNINHSFIEWFYKSMSTLVFFIVNIITRPIIISSICCIQVVVWIASLKSSIYNINCINIISFFFYK